jgi:hypothetical protein
MESQIEPITLVLIVCLNVAMGVKRLGMVQLLSIKLMQILLNL